MKTIRIDAKHHNEPILEDILLKVVEGSFKKGSFMVSLNKSIIVDIKDEENENLYIDFISTTLVNYIISNIEPSIIMEEVDMSCGEFYSDEIDEISQRVQWQMLYRNDETSQKYVKQLKNDIFNCLTNHRNFNLNGFLNFKYSERRIEIQSYINMVLDEYLTDDENDQFVSILKKFVAIQPILTKSIHVVILSDNDYEIITDKNERVDMKDIEEILEEIELENDISMIEHLHLIMSVLMTLSPNELKIHTKEKNDPYIAQTLKKIYEERAIICHDCDFCEIIKNTRNEE